MGSGIGPATVIEAQPNKVTAIRRSHRDGYDAVQLAADPVTPEDKLTKGELGHLRKAGAPAMRTLVEFRDAEVSTSEGVDAPAAADTDQAAEGEGGGGEEASSAAEGEIKIGDDVTVSSFEPGQRVKVSAVSVGKGFRARSSGTTSAVVP